MKLFKFKVFYLIFAMMILCFSTLLFNREPLIYGSNKEAGKYVEIDDIKVYYEVYGKGEPLLLLHNNGGSINVFSHQIPELQKHFKVIAMDSRSHGRTSDSDKSLTYQRMAEDVKLFLEALKVDSVNVVGWSDGGNTGLVLAQNYPAKVKKLVVMSANYDPSGLDRFFFNIISMAKYEMLSAHDRETRLQLSPNPERDAAVFKKQMDLMINYPKLTPEQLAGIKVPVLVTAGDQDIIQYEHTWKLFQSLPNAQLAVIPGTSHIALKEKPGLVNQLILDFLKTPFSKPNKYYFLME